MTLDLQYKIRNNKNYENYLREHSYWYKYLNRDPAIFNQFENEVKEYYKLTKADKFEKLLNGIELVGMIVSTLK